MKQYNGVPLDGRPMDILLATNEVAPATSRLGKVTPARDAGRRRYLIFFLNYLMIAIMS